MTWALFLQWTLHEQTPGHTRSPTDGTLPHTTRCRIRATDLKNHIQPYQIIVLSLNIKEQNYVSGYWMHSLHPTESGKPCFNENMQRTKSNQMQVQNHCARCSCKAWTFCLCPVPLSCVFTLQMLSFYIINLWPKSSTGVIWYSSVDIHGATPVSTSWGYNPLAFTALLQQSTQAHA